MVQRSLLVRLDDADPAPIYSQIERAIRAAIATSRIAKGDQLPTVRQLAVELRVNANTVAKVYSDLERDGVLETRRGVGTFVLEARTAPPGARPNRQALRDFVLRVLEEAAVRGFSRHELIAQLQAESKEEHHG